MSDATPNILKSAFLTFVRKFGETKDQSSKRTLYYEGAYDRHGSQGWFASWNWSAALFGCFWMCYRGMFVWGGILLAVEVGLDALFSHFFVDNWVVLNVLEVVDNWAILTVLQFIVFGIFGNAIYFCYARCEIKKGVKQRGTHLDGLFLALLIYIFLMWKIATEVGALSS